MESRPQSQRYFVFRQPSLLAVLCLVVLLPNLLLPLVYYAHLTKPSLPAASGDSRAGPQFILSPTAASGPHQPESCPICRAAGTFHDYACFSWIVDRLVVSPVGLAAPGDLHQQTKTCYLLALPPRAPPFFL